MARSSSVRLFTGYRLLNAWFEKLDLLLHEACDQHLQYDALPADDLPEKLRSAFLLQPLVIPGIVDVTVDAFGYPDPRGKGASGRLFRASARIPYQGSRVLLRTAPEPGFTFPYKGRIGVKSMRLDTVLPSMDPTAFVADARQQVARVQAALHRSRATIGQYNERIGDAIEGKLRTY